MGAYRHRTILRFRDTDAAGIIYFANYFALAHEALEACMLDHDLGIGRITHERDFILPLVHVDGDFSAPLRGDDEVVIDVTTKTIGRTSFTIAYAMAKIDGTPVCQAHTTHVAVKQATHKPIPIPDEVMAILEGLKPEG